MGTRQTVVDRLEGDKAVLEGMGAVPAALLPTGLREGDVLTLEVEDAQVILRIDAVARRAREAELEALRADLPKVDEPAGGEIEL